MAAAEKAIEAAKQKAGAPVHEFSKEAEDIIRKAEEKLGSDIPEEQKRFFAIKLLEKDDKIAEQMKQKADVSAEIKEMEDAFDDDTESIITNERYVYISSIIGECITKNGKKKLSTSDKIDRIVTNRWLALPIFAVVMWIVYYVSVTTVGSILTAYLELNRYTILHFRHFATPDPRPLYSKFPHFGHLISNLTFIPPLDKHQYRIKLC